MVLTAYEQGDATRLVTRQLGPALAVERLWRETGCGQVIDALAGEREFQFDVERAVFLTVLHRLFDPGSDRAAEKWRHGLVIDGVADLDLHHLYRAMGWLGEELADQSGRGIDPRTTKDLVEERLFAVRNNLFSELEAWFFSTPPRFILRVRAAAQPRPIRSFQGSPPRLEAGRARRCHRR